MKRHILVKLSAINPNGESLSVNDLCRRLFRRLKAEYGLGEASYFLPTGRSECPIWPEYLWSFGASDPLAVRAAAEEWNSNIMAAIKEASAEFDAATDEEDRILAAKKLNHATADIAADIADPYFGDRFVVLGNNSRIGAYLLQPLVDKILANPEDWALLEFEM